MSEKKFFFAQKENEATSDWSKRLIALNAPTHIISAPQSILEAETRFTPVPQPAGKYGFPNEFLLFCERKDY